MLNALVRVVVVFVALVRLFAPGIASADCAWVLWHVIYRVPAGLGPVLDIRSPFLAFDTRRECTAKAEQMTVKIDGETWECFPSTIDLREKAK